MATSTTAAGLDGWRPAPRRQGWTDGDKHHGGTAGQTATTATADKYNFLIFSML